MSATALQDPDPFPLREYSLRAFDIGEEGEEDVELVIHTPQNPDVRSFVSLAGLYMLAVMTLDQDGTVQRRMESLLDAGPINEVDAINRINLLLLKDANDQRV